MLPICFSFKKRNDLTKGDRVSEPNEIEWTFWSMHRTCL